MVISCFSKSPKEEKTPKSLPYYKLYKYANLLDKLQIFIGIIGSVICGILQPYVMILFGDVSNVILNYSTIVLNQNLTIEEELNAENDLYSGTRYFAIMTTVSAIVTIISTYISVLFFTQTSLRQTFRMRKFFLEKMLNQDISWYDQNQTGDFATIITDNIPKIEDGLGEKVGMVVFVLTTFISGIILALVRGWKLALICLSSFPLQMAVMGIITWLTAKYCKQEMEAYSMAGSVAEEVFSSLRTVIAFEGQEREAKRYAQHVEEAKTNNMKRCLFNSINQGFIWFLTFACYSLAFWYGVGLIIEDRLLPEEERVYTPGNMIAVFFCTMIASWNFGSIGPYLEVMGMAQGAAFRVFYILEGEPEMHDKKNKGKIPNFTSNIEFKNIKFTYPSRTDVEVLKNVSFNLNFGETVAFVGHSGSGKSTIIQLLQRFYDPNSGEISVDGIDLKEINLTHLRKNVSVVSQEPSLFSTTIAENIRYGKLNATMSEIIGAAQKANAHQFITNLPNGYQTMVGERGSQLSGGQKQRIAIARALIRSPKLLLLDEATSALDTASEIEVQQALDTIQGDCTKIIVAHRLSTIRNAKTIIVFDKGEIVEQGCHQTLLEKKGVYFKMVKSQGFTELDKENDVKKVANDSNNLVSKNFKELEKHSEEIMKEEDEIKTTLASNTILKILKMNSPEWFPMLLGSMASIINGASVPIYGWVFGDILGALTIIDDNEMRKITNSYCLYFLYIGIASGIGMFIQFYGFGYAGEKLIYRLRNRMFTTLLKQEMGFFDEKEHGVGALCAQLSGDAASVQGAGGARLAILLNSVSTFILAGFIAFFLDWRLTLVSMIFFPLVFFSISFERKSVEQQTQFNQKLLEHSSKIAVEAVDNIKTIKALGCESVFLNSYEAELIRCKATGLKRAHLKGVVIGFARSLQNMAYAAGMTYGAQLLTEKTIDAATVFVVLEVAISSSWSIGNVLSFSSNLQKGITAATKIITLFERTPTVTNNNNNNNLTNQIISYNLDNPSVEYSNLRFSYPTRTNTQILKDLNLIVAHGKTVALVGDSGCGKSTLIQLLLRFYDPLSGKVHINENDIRKLNIKFLRSQLGLVSQEPNLFDLTIAENIAYGLNNKKVPMKDIEIAAKAANIHNFIVSLPLGYETRLGNKGKQLSGGQKQRIAIARALLRDPKILLLDEATSALDNESEKIVQEALDNARKGKTCITIAHRLTTIQDADLICVVKNGTIAEKGTHNELLSLQGYYYDYYKLQSGQN